MAIVLKADQAKFLALDTNQDVFNDAASFSLEIVDANTGALVTNTATGTFTEIVWTDPAHTGTLSAEALAGASIVTATGHTFVAGDRFDDGAGNIYVITAVAGDNLNIKGKLKATIANAVVVSSVGNTGTYRVDVQLAAIGEYFVNFAAADFGHTAVKVEVVKNDVQDVYDRVDAGLNELGANKTFKVIA